ncbi:Protein TssJ3 [Pseudomonas syringae pv. viburni]|uniref:Protein TssJ3 n=1 Tax=Pseudomonas syringae pv. viburni TaxID=251703 RepID=A0A0N8TDC9_9PSED|nr:Protein TssJ3 [Pseudomonas syringae pv. viburni]
MTAKQFKYRQWIAVLLIAVVVAGCSLFGPRIRIDGVTLDVALRANDDSPITARRGHTVCGWMISAGYG